MIPKKKLYDNIIKEFEDFCGPNLNGVTNAIFDEYLSVSVALSLVPSLICNPFNHYLVMLLFL